MSDDPEAVPWEGQVWATAMRFASECAELRKSNPYQLHALDRLICDAASELRDYGFSVAEITSAMQEAMRLLKAGRI